MLRHRIKSYEMEYKWNPKIDVSKEIYPSNCRFFCFDNSPSLLSGF